MNPDDKRAALASLNAQRLRLAFGFHLLGHDREGCDVSRVALDRSIARSLGGDALEEHIAAVEHEEWLREKLRAPLGLPDPQDVGNDASGETAGAP